jgi:hypothetical protein
MAPKNKKRQEMVISCPFLSGKALSSARHRAYFLLYATARFFEVFDVALA